MLGDCFARLLPPVGIENKHDRLLLYRFIRVPDFAPQLQDFVEFRIVLERSRDGVNPIRLWLNVLDMGFQIGKLLLDLGEPSFKGRVGHDRLEKWSVLSNRRNHRIFPHMAAWGKGESSVASAELPHMPLR